LPGCGDGTRTPDEACYDGNVLACGTCSATCRQATPLAPATGTISIDADAVVDGETFVLDDGFGAIPFEFDDDDQLTSDGKVIKFSQPLNGQALRDAIVAAVNEASGLGITAVAGGTGTVMPTNDHLGTVGNHAMPVAPVIDLTAYPQAGVRRR
jgi:cysteine-rich repeat protein